MRKLLFVTMVLVLIAAGLWAGDTRQAVLGEGFVPDNNDILVNPALVGNYANTARAEFGMYGISPTDQWGVLTYGVGDNIGLGIAVNNRYGEIYSLTLPSGVPYPKNGVELLGSVNMGTLSFGLNFYHAGAKDYTKTTSSSTTTEVTRKSGIMAFTGGVALDGDALDIEGSIGIRMNGYMDETKTGGNTNSTELDGGMGISARARAFLEMSDVWTIVPLVTFSTFSYKEKRTMGSTVNERGTVSYMTLSAGAADNIVVGDDGLLSLGASVDINTVNDDSDTSDTDKNTMLSLPRLNLALEYPISDVFVVRAGVQKVLGSTKETEKTGGVTYETSSTTSEAAADFIRLGGAVNITDNLSVDCMISENLLYTGTYLASGISNALAIQLTATYTFFE